MAGPQAGGKGNSPDTATPLIRIWQIAGAAALLIAIRLAVTALLAPAGLVRGLCQWDCNWYVGLARDGYDLAPHLVSGLMQANWAFFPLFPVAMRGVAALTGLDFQAAGIIAATAGMLLFAVLGSLYRMRTRPGASPWLWLLVLVTWPYGFYFNAQYSESLYAALATACLLGLAGGRPWLAALSAAVLTATRPTGILLAAWVGLDRLWQARRARSLGQAALCLVPAAVAPLGLILFMAWLWWRVGDPLAFAHIQQAWGHSFRNPVLVLLDTVQVARDGHPGIFYDSGWALIGLAASAFLAVRRRAAEAWLLGATVMMALLSGVVWSMPRFVAANPAFLFAVADMTESMRSKFVRVPMLLAFAALQIFFLFGWFREAVYLM